MSKVIELNKRLQKRKNVTERTYDELITQCTDKDGVLDVMAIDELPAVGTNGGKKCDVTSGPCSCGAWH